MVKIGLTFEMRRKEKVAAKSSVVVVKQGLTLESRRLGKILRVRMSKVAAKVAGNSSKLNQKPRSREAKMVESKQSDERIFNGHLWLVQRASAAIRPNIRFGCPDPGH